DPTYFFGTNTLITVQTAINAVDPSHPTTAELSNDPANPRMLAVGTPVVWTYQLNNPGLVPLTITTFTDDARTPGNPSDDFSPTYVSGDANHNNKLDPGETWLYISSPHTYQVQPGLYGNTTTVTATDPTGQPVTTRYTNWHFGTTPSIFVLKAI